MDSYFCDDLGDVVFTMIFERVFTKLVLIKRAEKLDVW
jgi:hypothetical protein